MTSQPMSPTPTDLIAASSRILEAGGYRLILEGFPDWRTPTTRLYEDDYNVVGLAVFTTSSELLDSWADLQGSLVSVISGKVGQTEAKAWDGYLVLITAAMAPSGDLEIESIRADTTRLRKLVITGDDLATTGDVERVLRPLLPLRTEQQLPQGRAAFDLLPDLLAEQHIDRKITELLLRAFADQKPLMEELHRYRVTP